MWQFPVLLVLGGSIVAACSSKSKNPNEPEPATALAITTAPPTTFADRATINPAPVIQLVDANGDPVSSAGVSITASLTSGSGSLQGTTSVQTNGSGQAGFGNISISGPVGVKTITFSSTGLSSISTAALTLTVGPLALATANSVVLQSALTSTAVAAPPSVLVTDADGNPIQGQAVTFAITAGGGSLTGADQVTNASGIATVTSWTTGAAQGTNTMSATVGPLTPVVFNVSAAPAGVAVELQLLTAPPATIAARATIAPNPVIQLRDAAHAAVTTQGIVITVALTGGGTLNGTASVNTDAQGQATFSNLSIAGLVGAKRLQFSSTNLVGIQSGDITLTPGAASTIAANSETSQAGTIAAPVVTLPSVKVADQDGNGVAGVAVIFTLTGGGGTIGGASVNTNANGVATLGNWTLGPAAGANTVEASGNGVALGGAPVVFTVNATAAASNYNITLVNIGPPLSASRQAAFDQAKARWQQVITSELSDVFVGNTGPTCQSQNLNTTVDDVLIMFTLDSIDGPGQVLGSAGPCGIRLSNSLTVFGLMRFDTADVRGIEASGQLNDVILHEMGHVLGYGTLWSDFNLLQGACTPTPTFSGTNAVAAFTGSNGGSGTTIPVENFQPGICNNGTRDSHWEEDVFRSEVMTGFISGTIRPLSLTSVQSMKDLGYTVNTAAADPFNIGSQPTLRAAEAQGPVLDLRNDILNVPIYAIDDQGRMTLYRDRR